MATTQVFKNGVEEFGETLIIGALMGTSNAMIRQWTDKIENPILQDAVQSSLQVISFGLIFQLIRYEEQVIDAVFSKLGILVSSIFALPKNLRAKISNMRNSKRLMGRVGGRVLGAVSGLTENRSALGQALVAQGGNYMVARSNASGSQGLYHSYVQTKQSAHQADSLKLQLAQGMNDNYLQTLLFKLFTSNFSANDEVLLKKILGRESIGNLKIEDINRVGSFMFAKDDQNNIVGLSQAFLELLNGLGYLHKG